MPLTEQQNNAMEIDQDLPRKLSSPRPMSLCSSTTSLMSCKSGTGSTSSYMSVTSGTETTCPKLPSEVGGSSLSYALLRIDIEKPSMNIIDEKIIAKNSAERHIMMSHIFSYGKYKIFRPRDEIDDLWAKVREATVLGKLAYSASVTTFKKAYENCESRNKLHTITVFMYSRCSKDVDADIDEIRRRLAVLGIHEELDYIPCTKTEASCKPVPEMLVSTVDSAIEKISGIGIDDDDDGTINFSSLNAKNCLSIDTLIHNHMFSSPRTRNADNRYTRLDYEADQRHKNHDNHTQACRERRFLRDTTLGHIY